MGVMKQKGTTLRAHNETNSNELAKFRRVDVIGGPKMRRGGERGREEGRKEGSL